MLHIEATIVRCTTFLCFLSGKGIDNPPRRAHNERPRSRIIGRLKAIDAVAGIERWDGLHVRKGRDQLPCLQRVLGRTFKGAFGLHCLRDGDTVLLSRRFGEGRTHFETESFAFATPFGANGLGE